MTEAAFSLPAALVFAAAPLALVALFLLWFFRVRARLMQDTALREFVERVDEERAAEEEQERRQADDDGAVDAV